MIYEVSHVTRYRYEARVAANTCTLRLLPRSIDGQSVMDSRIDVTPPPKEWNERGDIFGNRVVRMPGTLRGGIADRHASRDCPTPQRRRGSPAAHQSGSSSPCSRSISSIPTALTQSEPV